MQQLVIGKMIHSHRKLMERIFLVIFHQSKISKYQDSPIPIWPCNIQYPDKVCNIFHFRKTDSEDSESNSDGGGRIRKKFKCFCFCCGKKSSDQDSDSDDEFGENHVNGGFEQEVVTNGNNGNS